MSLVTLGSSPAYEQLGGWGVKEIVDELHAARDRWRAAQQRSLEFAVREFPSREALREIAEALCGALFPMRLGPPDLHQEGEDFYVGHTLDRALNALFQQVQLELGYNRRLNCEEKEGVEVHAAEIVKAFARQLPEVRRILDTDVQAAYLGDPAARSVDEVLLCYPGILAVIHYRLAHHLYVLGVPLIARILAEIAHSITGIDIHPGAQIGPGFFIDHGTGVVIGETTVIGSNVRIYQAVTLGAKRFTQDESGALEKGAPRHPILEDEVVVYAGATILGRITIGRGSSIGGNVWLTRSVPPGSHVSQASVQHEPGGAGKVAQ
jgi:serine O-acetyltransferase